MNTSVGPGTRRERLREATLREIQESARRRLLAEGPSGVSLRAIARDLGMTAPALYRYFDSHEALITALIAGFFTELADELERTRQAAGDDPSAQLLQVSRRFRAWALEHSAEFGLLFGSPLPGYEAPPDGPTHEAGDRFARVWLTTFLQLWHAQPFDIAPRRPVPESYVTQLQAYAHFVGGDLPAHAVRVFLECWARLYGQICLEVFGHLHFALSDAEPMFEAMLMELSDRLGIDYSGV